MKDHDIVDLYWAREERTLTDMGCGIDHDHVFYEEEVIRTEN